MESYGNALALVFPNRSIGIIDWGISDPQVFRDFFDRENVTRVNFVLATHAHGDHTAGLLGILEEVIKRNVDFGHFVVPITGPLTDKKSDHIGKAKRYAKDHYKKLRPVFMAVNDVIDAPKQRPPLLFQTNDFEISLLAPDSSTIVRSEVAADVAGRNPGNESSIVLLFRFRGHDGPEGRMLLPGDATPVILKYADSHAKFFPDLSICSDVIVAAHHGSRHNWPEFLFDRAVGSVLVSCGPSDNHHPAESFLKRVGEHCAEGDGCSRLFCTSYARQCHLAFSGRAKRNERHLVLEGPCFGDLVVELRPDGSRVVSDTTRGDKRRRFGFCGQ